MEINERQIFKINTGLNNLQILNNTTYKNYDKLISSINDTIKQKVDNITLEDYSKAITFLNSDEIRRAEDLKNSNLYQSQKALLDSILSANSELNKKFTLYTKIIRSEEFKRAKEILDSKEVQDAEEFMKSDQIVKAKEILSNFKLIMAEELARDISILNSNEFKINFEIIDLLNIFNTPEMKEKLNIITNKEFAEQAASLIDKKEKIKILNSKKFKDAEKTIKEYNKVLKELNSLSNKYKELNDSDIQYNKTLEEKIDNLSNIDELTEEQSIQLDLYKTIKESDNYKLYLDLNELQTKIETFKNIEELQSFVESDEIKEALEIKNDDEFKQLSKTVSQNKKIRNEFEKQYGEQYKVFTSYNQTDIIKAENYVNSQEIKRIVYLKEKGEYDEAIKLLSAKEYTDSKVSISSEDYKKSAYVLNSPEYKKATAYLESIDYDSISAFFKSTEYIEYVNLIESDKVKEYMSVVNNQIVVNQLRKLSTPEYKIAKFNSLKYSNNVAKELISSKLITITKDKNKVPLLYKGESDVMSKVVISTGENLMQDIHTVMNNETGEFKAIDIIDFYKINEDSYIVNYKKII